MKFKFLQCVVVLLCVVQGAIAQTYLGVSGGAGLNNQVGLRASIPIEHIVSKSFSVRAAATFTQHHNPEILFLLHNKRDYRRVTLSYLGIPLHAKFRLSLGTVHLYGVIGPQINYATHLTASYLEDEIFGTEKLDFNQLKIRHWDIGINAGAGIEKNITNNCKIYVEVLLFLGLQDIDERSNSEIFNEGNIFNLGFLLPIVPNIIRQNRQ